MRIQALLHSGPAALASGATWQQFSSFSDLRDFLYRDFDERVEGKVVVIVKFVGEHNRQLRFDVNYANRPLSWSPVLDVHEELVRVFAEGQLAQDVLTTIELSSAQP